MKDRAATDVIRFTLFRLFLGVAGICLLYVPAHPIHAASHEEMQTGATLFQERGCVRCHGATAAGTAKGPDLRTIGKRWKKSEIERQIVEGGYEMPPFQDALDHDEVKTLVAYLSAMRKLPKDHAGTSDSHTQPYSR